MADQGVLGDLRQAGPEPASGVAAGHLDVADDHDRLMDGAHQVAAAAEVDGVLAADRGVGLRDQRGRDQAELHAAVEGRRDEAGDIADGLAADGDDEVVLVDGVVGEHVGQVLDGPERLRRLGVRQRDVMRGDADPGQLFPDPGRHARVLAGRHDQGALHLGQRRQQRADVLDQARPDVGVVGPADGGDEDAGAAGRDRGQPGEGGQGVQGDGIRSPPVGVDGEDGEVLVDGQPPLVHLVEVGPVQHRPEFVALDARQGLVVADAEVDDPGVAQRGPAPRVLHRAAAEGDHGFRPADEVGHRDVLELAEVGLALGGEDVPDVTSEPLLDQHVAVHEGQSEPFGDDVPHRGLAGPHEADQHHHHRILLRMSGNEGMLPLPPGSPAR